MTLPSMPGVADPDALLDPLFERAASPRVRSLRADRARLVTGPTPLEPLDRLRSALGGGPRLWIKRDDLTGLALGGNKARKLEYLLAQARAEGADTLVTVGAAQSNHARQTAAAAARIGLDAVLVMRVPPGQPPEYLDSGNVLLDRLLGARLVLVDETPDDPHPERAAAEREVDRLRAEGRRPFLIPSGGSTPVGALGYLESYAEIAASGIPFREIVVASGSGGTQAGLLTGRALLGSGSGPDPADGPGSLPSVQGIAVAPGAVELAAEVDELAAAVVGLLGGERDPDPAVIDPAVIDPGHVGEGYGIPTAAGIEAIRLFARSEGILLDPVYTAKAAAGLIARVRAGAYPEDADVLLLHTGGAPALFAHQAALNRED